MKNILVVDDEKDVLEVTKKILLKNQYGVITADIPIIFVTGRGEQFDRDYGLELGAYEYIFKPCDAVFLLRQVERALSKSKPR